MSRGLALNSRLYLLARAVVGCSASCIWRVSRGLALDYRFCLVSTGFGCSASCIWRVSRGLALNSRLYLVRPGRVVAAVHHVSGE